MFNYQNWCKYKDAVHYTFSICIQTSTVFFESLYEFSPIKNYDVHSSNEHNLGEISL